MWLNALEPYYRWSNLVAYAKLIKRNFQEWEI